MVLAETVLLLLVAVVVACVVNLWYIRSFCGLLIRHAIMHAFIHSFSQSASQSVGLLLIHFKPSLVIVIVVVAAATAVATDNVTNILLSH